MLQKNILNINLEIGKKIRQLRKSKNLTLAQISQFVKVTPQQFQKYETGYTEVPFAKLYILVQIFKVEPSYFLENNN